MKQVLLYSLWGQSTHAHVHCDYLQHEPKSRKNGRISQHYKASLTGTFDLYPVSVITVLWKSSSLLSPSLSVCSVYDNHWGGPGCVFGLLLLLQSDYAPARFWPQRVLCVGLERSGIRPLLSGSCTAISSWDYAWTRMVGLLVFMKLLHQFWAVVVIKIMIFINCTTFKCQHPLYPLIRMLKRSLYKHELEPNWPSPEKVSSTYMYVHTRAILNYCEIHVYISF